MPLCGIDLGPPPYSLEYGGYALHRRLYPPCNPLGLVFYALHRRLGGPLGYKYRLFPPLYMGSAGATQSYMHKKHRRLGGLIAYGSAILYHIRPTLKVPPCNPLNSMLCIEDWWPLAGGVIKPILRLVFYAEHRRLGVQRGCCKGIWGYLKVPPVFYALHRI
jgi:hypothetical protein